MLQVKMFQGKASYLEGQINKFLSQNPSIDVIDIKLSSESDNVYGTAMIIYKTK